MSTNETKTGRNETMDDATKATLQLVIEKVHNEGGDMTVHAGQNKWRVYLGDRGVVVSVEITREDLCHTNYLRFAWA